MNTNMLGGDGKTGDCQYDTSWNVYPGSVNRACDILVVSIEELMVKENVRKVLKEKVLQIQSSELVKRMLVSSKMDKALINGSVYDGKMKKYLYELNFLQARAIFMSRYRMWPTKANYPGRWKGTECNICGLKDTDEHISTCPGYCDIVGGSFGFDVFWDEAVLDDIVRLKGIADVVLVLMERMEVVQSIG